MSETLSAAYEHCKQFGNPPELTFDLVLEYFLENKCRVQNIELVKDFQFFLVRTDSQENNRKLFRDFVDKLADMQIEANGEKFLILKEKFGKPKPKKSDTTMPFIANRLSYQEPKGSLMSPTSPVSPTVFYGDNSPILPSRPGNPGPPLRVTSDTPTTPQTQSLHAADRLTKYPSPILSLRPEIFSNNSSRTNTPTLGGSRVLHELSSFMPAALRIRDTASIHSSEADRSSMELSRNLEHAWVTACVTGNDEQIHRMLLEDANFCHYQDYIYGYTGLHWAAKQGHIEILASLLMAGADVNARSFGGHSALHLAAQQNQEKVIEFLVNQCDADVDSRDNYGKPPSDYLPESATKRCKYWLRKEHNASVYSPLHYTSQMKQESRKIFGSQGELTGLERTASRIRVSFRRKSKALSLQRSNTVGVINSS